MVVPDWNDRLGFSPAIDRAVSPPTRKHQPSVRKRSLQCRFSVDFLMRTIEWRFLLD
jgi:hypothetical protein